MSADSATGAGVESPRTLVKSAPVLSFSSHFRYNDGIVKLASIEAIVRALNDAGVRYLVAGGLAVNAHGYLRFTKDIDVVIQLIPENVMRAFGALGTLGYQPIAPVTAEQFADRSTREGWIRDKNMQVLQLWSDHHRETSIDIFVTELFPFEEEYAKALIKPLYGTIDVRFVSIPTLIAMKEAAGRAQDKIDIEHLRMRLEGDA
jgi:hypothetical protein